MKKISLGRGGRPLRIAYGRLFHEANAFSPSLTTKADFERMHHMAGDELAQAATRRGTELKSFMPHAELTGFRTACDLAGQVETVPLASSLAVPSGPLTRECFDELTGDLIERIKKAGPLDGVYLALHGSMQVDGLGEPPEANLLRRVRALVGARVKIAVSYDLHANLSAGLVDPVDVLVAYRTNPHWDLAPTGFRAGNRLVRALRGQVDPVHAWRKLPLVLGGGVTIDFLAPMRAVFKWMKKLEEDPRVLSASLFMVHPYTTAERLGWAVHISTDGDPLLAEKLADQLADRAWAQKDVALPPMKSAREAIDEAASSHWKKLGPITFVDVDDIVGAGAPGGNTHIVKAFVEDGRDLTAFVAVHDPALVDELWEAPLGAERSVTLRGTPDYHMPEVPLRVTVAARANQDFGRAIRLDAGKLHVVVTETGPLPIHPSFWADVGLRARDADVIVQKNFFHYRMFYLTTSFRHIPVISDGATNLRRVATADYEVPTHPAAKVHDWRDYDPVLRAPRGPRSNRPGSTPVKESSSKITEPEQTVAR